MSLFDRLRRGLAAGWLVPRLRASLLFDPDWYLDSHADLRHRDGRGPDPAWHYLLHGAREGRDPGPLFSTSGAWLQGGPRGETPAQNPLLAFERKGRATGQQALPVFEGTDPRVRAGAPVVLVFAHQALGQQFGAERSLLFLLDRAVRAGLAVDVVLPQCLDPAYLAALRARARHVHLLPCPWRRAGRRPHPSTLAAMEALIRNSGAGEVHQNTLALDAPLIAARRAGVPSVLHLRELPDQDAELCSRLGQDADSLRADLLTEADRFVANSAAVARWIDPAGALPPDRLAILPNAADATLAALPFVPAQPLRVGMVSSNLAKKGIADVAAAARHFADLQGEAEFLLIGPATADLAALGPLPDNLRHAGYAPDPVTAMAGLDVVLCLSHFAESFGRTVLEAMTAGRPVICYDRGTPPALVGTAGIVVPPDNPKAVARAVLVLSRDRARLRALSDAARGRARDVAQQAAGLPDSILFAALCPAK